MGDLDRPDGAVSVAGDLRLGRVIAILGVAAVAGWVGFRVGARVLPAPTIAWWAGMLIAVSVVILLAPRLMPDRGVVSEAALVAAGGWSLAASAGWSFSVAVGGAFAGLVTAVALDRRESRASLLHLAFVFIVGLLALCGSWWMVGGRGVIVTLAVGAPLAGLALAAPAKLRRGLPRYWMAWILGAGLIWVGAWAAAVRTVGTSPSGYGVALGELILAFSGMGLLTVLLLSMRGGTAGVTLVAWLAAGLVAAGGGMLVDTGLGQLYALLRGHASQPGAFLDIGHAVAMAVGAAIAVVVAYRMDRSSESTTVARPASLASRS
jgi:hypothetical protein